MFKVGDEVVFKNDYNSDDYYPRGKNDYIWVVTDISPSGNFVRINGVDYFYNNDQFLNIMDYRKLKINKLKENICSKKMMK